MCGCVCVCVCTCERERETERMGGGERNNLCVCEVCVICWYQYFRQKYVLEEEGAKGCTPSLPLLRERERNVFVCEAVRLYRKCRRPPPSLSLSVASAADEAWYWPKPEVYVHVCSSNLLVWSTCTFGPAHATTSMYMYI